MMSDLESFKVCPMLVSDEPIMLNLGNGNDVTCCDWQGGSVYKSDWFKWRALRHSTEDCKQACYSIQLIHKARWKYKLRW